MTQIHEPEGGTFERGAGLLLAAAQANGVKADDEHVVNRLRDCEAFGAFEVAAVARMNQAGGPIARIGPGFSINSTWVVNGLARWMLQETESGKGVDGIVARASGFLSRRSTRGRQVIIAWGPRVCAGGFDIGGIRVVPIEECDFSEMGKSVLNRFADLARLPAMWTPPNLAILQPIVIDGAFVRDEHSTAPLDLTEPGSRVAASLSLATPAPVIPASSWFENDDRDWEGVMGRSGSSSGPRGGFFPELVVSRYTTLGPECVEHVTSLMTQDESRWTRLTIVAERLNRARTSLTIGEAALDVGIALETTLMRNERSEISSKLGLRAAWLLHPSNDSERSRVHDVVRTAYNLRCDFAHRGLQPKDGIEIGEQTLRAGDLVQEAGEVARLAMLELMKRPRDPSWDDVVLNLDDRC